MRVSIRTKLLVICIALVLLTTTGISITYYVLTRQDKQRASRQQIQIAFNILLNDFAKRINTYAVSVRQFLQENVTLLWATYTYSLDDSEDGTIRFLCDHFPDVSAELKQFGRVALADRVMLYGANKRLLVVYQRLNGRETRGGYLVSAEEGNKYLPMDNLSVQAEITFRRNNLAIHVTNTELPETPFPQGVSAMYAGDVPDVVSVGLFRLHQQLGIRVVAPIYRRDQVMGILIGETFFTQDMIEEYASLSNTEINFFSGAALSIGTLPFQSELAPLVPEQEVRCQDMLTTHQGITVIPITLEEHKYYQGQCTLNNGQESIGAITVNLSQEIEQQEIAKIVKAVSTISGVGILICVVLVSGVLVPKFTGPIITLTNAALRMAQGDLNQKIDTSGQDELGTLARSFAHMRDEIQQKIEELQHLNAELDQRVEERTAEVVRQKYILDTFMETVPDRIYFKDCQGRITRANKAHASRMGVLDPSQEIGKTDFDFFPYKDAQRRYEQEQEILRSGTPLIGMEEQRKWPDGHEEWSLVTKMPLRNEHGEIIGTFGVSRDITELKHTEDALRHAKNAAEAANRAKSEFLANMSHELRTPLNVILGLTQIMTRNPQFLKEERENLDIIHHSGEHLLMLINNVLDLSKIEAGRIPINESSIDLFRLLDELKEMFAVKAAPKQLDLLFDYAEDVPQYVRLDAGKLRQVLINLLNNAVKFTEAGGVTLGVKAEIEGQRAKGEGQLQFSISDTGPGIAPEEMTMLFEAFAQTQTGRSAQEGTGLGLAISQKFVQLLGGTIAVESELQRGTTFKFTIPVTLANASDVVASSVTQRVIALQPDQPRYRILVVDDNPHNRRLLVKLLVPLGFDVREAENGQDGIRLWKEFEPHLIWMDLRMPGLDGYEAIRQIRKLEGQKAVIIIALTASSFEDEREHVLAAGCDDFLRKPFRETEIFDLLHTHLGVRYVYEEPLQSGEKRTDRTIENLLTPAILATLPPALYTDLQQAVNVTDPGMMHQLLLKVREHDADLADVLHQLVQEFRFDILQTMFEV